MNERKNVRKLMYGICMCMYGIDGWMDGWMGGWTNAWMDGKYRPIVKWVNASVLNDEKHHEIVTLYF